MMKMHVLKCPNCGASIEIEDGLDTCYCKYCGYKIILEGQSDQAYKSKTRIKELEHEERMADKALEQVKSKLEAKRNKEKEDNKEYWKMMKGGLILTILMVLIMIGPLRWHSINEEKKLQKTVDEVIVDIQDGNLDEARIKALSIVFSGNERDEEKWDNIREELIKQIDEAKEKTSE